MSKPYSKLNSPQKIPLSRITIINIAFSTEPENFEFFELLS